MCTYYISSWGKHVTYRSSMESGCWFPELENMHLVLGLFNGNAADAVIRYKEEYSNWSVKLLYSTFSWSPTARHRNISQNAMGMLSMCVMYVMYGWKSRSSELLKNSRPSVPDVLQLVEVPPRLLYALHYKSSNCVPFAPRLLELVSYDSPAGLVFC
jgi:hypothetical protein